MEKKSAENGYYISSVEKGKISRRRQREKRKKLLFLSFFVFAAIATLSLIMYAIFGGTLFGSENKIYEVNDIKINPMLFEGKITLRAVVTEVYTDIAREEDFAISDRNEVFYETNGEKYSVFVKYIGNTAMPLFGEDIIITGEFHKNKSDGKIIFIADSYEFKDNLSEKLGGW